MLTISRDAEVKVGKHAWHVFPLEAFGYLLGRYEAGELTVYAALPCSKTLHWDEYDDRWNGIDKHLEMARSVGGKFDLGIVGLYATTEDCDRAIYPLPKCFFNQKTELLLLYHARCCRSCSNISLRRNGHWRWFFEEGVICRGKRISDTLNQKKIMKQWLKVYGSVDYSNGYEEGMCRG